MQIVKASVAIVWVLAVVLSMLSARAGTVAPEANSLGMKMVAIPAGNFIMGSPASEAGRQENEIQHKTTLTKGFFMAATLVTQGQWKAIMEKNPSHFPGDDLPVENVSYDDALAFCSKLSEKEGKHYRLPTEAEWEYACRAGAATAYYTGDGEQALDDAGWYNGNSAQTTHPAGQKKANAWGLFDMHGNVYQWCSDWYADYPQGNATDPQGPDNGQNRVLRGGAWNGYPQQCRSASRLGFAPTLRLDFIGLRVALDSK